MFLISQSPNLTAVMHTILLQDNTLNHSGRNDVPGGWHTGRQTGRTCGIRFARIPCIIRQVRQSNFLTEMTLATCLRRRRRRRRLLLLLLPVAIKLPVSCSTTRILRRGLVWGLALPHVKLDNSRSVCKTPGKALCKVLHFPRGVEWGYRRYHKQASEEEVQIRT